MQDVMKKRSTKKVLDYLRGEAPTPDDATPVPPPLPEMETDDEDLAMLPLTRPSGKSKLFRR